MDRVLDRASQLLLPEPRSLIAGTRPRKPRRKVMEKPPIGKARALVLGAAMGVSILTAAWLAWLTRSPERRAPAGASGSASRTERPRQVPLDPRDAGITQDALGTHAPIDRATHDDEVASSPGSAAEPGIAADVRPDPPPEAFLAAQPPARSPDRDTGLVFRNEPPGDDARMAGKEVPPPALQAPPDGLARPGGSADVHPPPDPAAWLPGPPRTGPDRDTGLVFSDRPGAAGAGDDKR
jgi:hypothetical protein